MEQVDQFNRQEFEQFTVKWDNHLAAMRLNITKQINSLIDSHEQQMRDLQEYLKQTLPVKLKPSADLLNLRKIEATLSKQKK